MRRLGELADEVAFPQGSPVVEAGAPGGTLYVMLEGEAKVVRAGKVVARGLRQIERPLTGQGCWPPSTSGGGR